MFQIKHHPAQPDVYAMCFDPATATAATYAAYASAAAAVVGAGAAIYSGQEQKKQSKYQAEVANQQATRERQIGAINEQKRRRMIARDIGTIRAAKGGLRDSGLLTAMDFVGEAEHAALMERSNAQTQATRLEQQAQLYRTQGRAAQTQGFLRGGALLLQGLHQHHHA
jgi:hypothetical protein